MKTQSQLLKGLNTDQHRAVVTTEGPLLVLAGAGTGKTRVITIRTVHLMNEGIAPENILLVTFTNKAAREMRERLRKLCGKKAEEVTCGTFHSFCIRLIREHHEKLGLPKSFGICDSSDQLNAIKAQLRELRISETSVNPRTAQSRISLYKNSMILPEDAFKEAEDDYDIMIARCYEKYQEYLRRSRVVDFDDFLLYTHELLRDNEDVRAQLEKQFKYVMIDEYQDTNTPQYEIIRAIVKNHRNICVVGDDDQSIYGWRGADIQKILGFEKDFPGAGKVYLGTNYRSTQEIIDAANMVIKNNSSRHEKELRSAYGSGENVSILRVEDEIHEASHICGDIRHQVGREQAHYSDFAILCRTAQQPRAFETELRSANIPYKLVGGQSFFDRKEVRDILAYLRVIDNPADETSFLRIVNTPPRGIGKGTIDKILAKATEEGKGAYAVFKESHAAKELAAAASKGFGKLSDALRTAYISVQANEDLVATLRKLISDIDYHEEVARCYPDPDTAQVRWAGVDEILNFAENYQRKNGTADLNGFLQEMMLDESDNDDDSNVVTLMTLHAAKGLEFRNVYLVGLEEGLLPHKRAAIEGSIEEERRLMYVGVTRAQRLLLMTFCTARAKFGKLQSCHPSRFLFEMKGKAPPDDWVP
ncbi:MAG: UvrD-helicase domain-containing protein, partial [Planctomycetota bacterium]|nr:UvrD-helicase domain-containing protein [Planctomycetota bacterium]